MITAFPSHEEVRCLKCDQDLAEQVEFGQLKMLQIGAWAKKCPSCQLVTSYDLDVTPREAALAEWELEEPDWPQAFEAEQMRWPKIPKHLREELAFEEVLKRWRKWHWTPTDNGKKMPAGATEAIIALVKLGIMPPRSAHEPVERDGELGYQQDDHMWLSISQEQWRITAIEDHILHLQKGFQADVELKQIDLGRAKWNDYIAASVAVLEARLGKGS